MRPDVVKYIVDVVRYNGRLPQYKELTLDETVDAIARDFPRVEMHITVAFKDDTPIAWAEDYADCLSGYRCVTIVSKRMPRELFERLKEALALAVAGIWYESRPTMQELAYKLEYAKALFINDILIIAIGEPLKDSTSFIYVFFP